MLLRDLQETLPRPLAFVLSGGAAMGSIQIGMLKALAELRIEPDIIVGTSVGALNGAAIANHGLIDGANKLVELWSKLDRQHVFPGGRLAQVRQVLSTQNSLFPNNGLTKIICDMLTASRFDELAIPFAALATDVMTLHGALFYSGDLHKSLLASTAIPGFFPPVEIGGRHYADGGITANVPLRSAEKLGARSIIVLDAGEMCHRLNLPENLLMYFDMGLQGVMRQRVRIEAPVMAEKMPLIYLPTPCPVISDAMDFSDSVSLINQSYHMAKMFIKTESLPAAGKMTGAPHYHGDEPIFSLTELKTAE